ncbi:MAG: hypothetical protein RLZZ28_1071 [Bacteroidota bacterium]|jgi:adenosylmethionine-8-amino-7-oxononanoate aminotransferase
MNLSERDQEFIWHPFTQQKNRTPAIPIVKGEGALLFAEDGKSYIDSISSWWVNLHGHAHPYIAEKLYRQALQLEQVIFAGFTHRPAVELAERLMPKLPGQFSKIFYSDNGSTATEVAIKMAIQFWWNKGNFRRKKILAFRDAYHGDTFGAMSVSDRSVFTLAFQDYLFEVIFIQTPTSENITELKTIVGASGNDIAAFIYEPLIQGAGGMKIYGKKEMEELLVCVKNAGIICIADEVMTGFGRTGKLFASEHLFTKPDIICLSKGLTGGTMALGITACAPFIYEAFLQEDKLKTFFHGHSFTANPLACTAALASLDLIEKETCMAAIETITQKNEAFVRELRETKGIVSARSIGTIAAFELDHRKNEYLNNISTACTVYAMEYGVYIRPLGNTVYSMPPYCITEADLEKVYETMKGIIETFGH